MGSIVIDGTYEITTTAASVGQTAATAVYTSLAGETCDFSNPFADLVAQILVPGVYCFSSSLANTGTFTLDAQGDPLARWVFQIGSTLIADPGTSIVLANGTQQCNIFWQVGSSATLKVGSTFAGSIIALASVTLETGTVLDGRAIARTGAVTMDTNNVSVSCCYPPTPAPTAPPTAPPTQTPTPAPTAPSCSDTCPMLANSQGIVDSQCGQIGAGICVGATWQCNITAETENGKGTCAGTATACCANADCECGCRQVIVMDTYNYGEIAVACPILCILAEECPDPQPENMCMQRDCWDGMCMDVPALTCEEYPNPDPCTIDVCKTVYNATIDQFYAICEHELIEGCCQQASDCLDQGNACQYAVCSSLNQYGQGTCSLESLGSNCCLTDLDCVDAFNLCAISTCNLVSNNCTEPIEKNCSAILGSNADRCQRPICNGTSGICYWHELGPELCPGACCLPDGSCNDNDMMDLDWCLIENGIFHGINTTCDGVYCITPAPTPQPTPEPTPQPTPAPTSLPTPVPTPMPTRQCSNDYDCPANFLNKCKHRICLENGTCSFTDTTCVAPTNCTTSTCQPTTGLCKIQRNWSCCEPKNNATDCFDSGELCNSPFCNVTAPNATTGTCTLLEIPDCCDSDADCAVPNDLCNIHTCNRFTKRCRTVAKTCPFDLDGDLECTTPACNGLTGRCQEQAISGRHKCPGACCATDGTWCTDTGDFFDCTGRGVWIDSGVVCGEITCPTPTPTAFPSVPPTPVPTAEPIGACCYSLRCEEIPFSQCEGGIWHGAMTLCNDYCYGVCCCPSGICMASLTEASCATECDDVNVPFLVGETCATATCPTQVPTPLPTSVPTPLPTVAEGACCGFNYCGESTFEQCDRDGSAIWKGAGTLCIDVCNGACCCSDGTCRYTTEEFCIVSCENNGLSETVFVLGSTCDVITQCPTEHPTPQPTSVPQMLAVPTTDDYAWTLCQILNDCAPANTVQCQLDNTCPGLNCC